MRKLMRTVAKANMARTGMTQVCKNRNRYGGKFDSWFSIHWREYLDYAPARRPRRGA